MNPFRIPDVPLALPMDGYLYKTWNDWERDARAKYPVRFFLSRTLPRAFARLRERLISRPWYYLRTHTVHRYHLIDMRCPRNGYAWGWLDRSEAVMFAAFAVLRDFVEHEYPGCVNWDWSDESRAARDEILALYKWWTEGRKQEHDAVDARAPGSGPHGTNPEPHTAMASFHAAVAALDEKDNEMLRRLIAVRGTMWT
jgi:hypothetical protein